MFVAIPLAAITLVFYSAQAVPAGGLGGPAVAQNSARSDDGPAQRLAADDGEVVSVYNMLLATPRRERVGAFRELPSSTKSAVWRHHLTKMEAEHPELSAEQRSVIKDFISLLTPDLYNVSAEDSHWKTAVQDPLEEIRRRAFAAFPRDLLLAVFLDIQPRDSARARVATSTSLHPSPENIAYCDCNRNFDDCFYWNGAGSYCSLGCYFTQSWGCGPGWVMRCDGYCTPGDPVD